ncbi:hypothetical protein [Oceaniradius stylonematis]|uniref:hypothetical protein n=1 Tax=Oceaniradius stylonematis TaxID=2184161 RepID=UPI003C7C8378
MGGIIGPHFPSSPVPFPTSSSEIAARPSAAQTRGGPKSHNSGRCARCTESGAQASVIDEITLDARWRQRHAMTAECRLKNQRHALMAVAFDWAGRVNIERLKPVAPKGRGTRFEGSAAHSSGPSVP